MTNWKRLFDAEIIERGRRYFYAGKVKEYSEYDRVVMATVSGAHNYEVFIQLDEGGGIRNTDCDCPYADSGLNCKHEAAVLFEYENRHKAETAIPQDAAADIDLTKTKIQHLRRRYLGRDSFIEYWQARRFVAEILGFLDKDVNLLIRQGKLLDAFDLVNFIFEKICNTPMDDDGEIMETVDEVSSIWQEIYNKADSKTRKTIFDWLMRKLINPKNEVITQAAEIFVMSAFEDRNELDQKLRYCNKMINKYNKGEIEYDGSRWIVYKVKILEQLGYSDEDIQNYYKKFKEDSALSIYYADWLILKNKHEDAREILEKTLKESSNNRGHRFCECGERLEKIYGIMGDIESQKMILQEMLCCHIGDDERLYNRLKSLYEKDEWNKSRASIIRHLSRHYDKLHYYEKEKMYDELIDIIKRRRSLNDLWKYADKLSDKYPSEIVELYISILKEVAPQAQNRMQYKDLMKHLKKISQLNKGNKKALALVDEWRIIFKNKRAMMDELNKVFRNDSIFK